MFARRAMRMSIVCLVGLGLLAQPLGALASACRGMEGKAPRACCGCCAAAAQLEQVAKPSCCRKREVAAALSRGCCAERPSAKPTSVRLSALAGLHNCCCSGSSDPAPSAPAPHRPAGSGQNELLLLVQLAPADGWTIAGVEGRDFGLHGLAPPPLAGRALLPRLCVWRI
ncbi:MAG: hypothetical protein U0836_23395 [Pirellulales bacterium]